LLAKAAAVLCAARWELVTRPFDRAIRFGCDPVGAPNCKSRVSEIVWAVNAIGRRVPFRALCIERGMAAQRLLRRAGHDAHLHYGARSASGRELEAHVWVTINGEPVIGGDGADDFAELASYS
jgi:hypothetical protein